MKNFITSTFVGKKKTLPRMARLGITLNTFTWICYRVESEPSALTSTAQILHFYTVAAFSIVST